MTVFLLYTSMLLSILANSYTYEQDIIPVEVGNAVYTFIYGTSSGLHSLNKGSVPYRISTSC
jgi:hypothetical protein